MGKLTKEDEERLAAEVEVLRRRSPDTYSLYKELARRLFYDFGIAPNSNYLFSAVGKGTKTAPDEPLRDFWDEVRDKSRVRIERGDMPRSIVDAAANLLDVIFLEANRAADESLATHRAAATDQADQAESRRAEEKERRIAAESHAAALQAELEDAQSQLADIQRQLTASETSRGDLASRLKEAQFEIKEAGRRADEVVASRAAELARAEEKANALEARLTAQIETERAATADIRRQRDASQIAADRLTSDLAGAREHAATLHGNLVAMEIQRTNLEAALRECQRTLAVREASLQVCQAELSRMRAEAAGGDIAGASTHARVRRRRRVR
jgi:chromosome segregation ATPase